MSRTSTLYMGNEKSTSAWDLIPKRFLFYAILVLVGALTGSNLVTFNWTRGVFEEEPQQTIEEAVAAALEEKRLRDAENRRRLDISTRLDANEAAIAKILARQDSAFGSISKGLYLIQSDIKRFHGESP